MIRAAIGEPVPIETVMRQLVGMLTEHIDKPKSHDVANMLEVCVSMGMTEMEVVLPLLQAYPHLRRKNVSQDGATALWAAACLGYRDEAYVEACLTGLCLKVNSARAQDLVRGLWAIAKLELVEDAAARRVLWRALDLAEDFSPMQAVTVLDAAGQLGVLNDEGAMRMLRQLTQNVTSWQLYPVALALRALHRAGYEEMPFEAEEMLDWFSARVGRADVATCTVALGGLQPLLKSKDPRLRKVSDHFMKLQGKPSLVPRLQM